MLCISLGVVGIIVNYTDIYYTTLDTHTRTYSNTHTQCAVHLPCGSLLPYE